MELELVPKETFDSPASKTLNDDEPVYVGKERRVADRRVTVERRSMIRFESKGDRRSGQDRRSILQLWKGRDKL